MTVFAVATGIAWLISLGLGASAFRAQGLINRLRRLLLALIGVVLSVVLTGLLVLLHAFRAFSGETLVAEVTTRRLSPEEFELTYQLLPAPASGRQAGADASTSGLRTIHLRGDQWAISGGVIKWHPWLTALGVKSYHKPMRLGGQFSSLEQQRSHYPTIYPLEPGVDRVWEAFYWADRVLPFVEAVYGSSAYAYVEPQAVQEIYVSPSGYLIKRR